MKYFTEIKKTDGKFHRNGKKCGKKKFPSISNKSRG